MIDPPSSMIVICYLGRQRKLLLPEPTNSQLLWNTPQPHIFLCKIVINISWICIKKEGDYYFGDWNYNPVHWELLITLLIAKYYPANLNNFPADWELLSCWLRITFLLIENYYSAGWEILPSWLEIVTLPIGNYYSATLKLLHCLFRATAVRGHLLPYKY